MLLKVKTGDILLFRSQHSGAKCQRCFTGAHYDHAALLVKRNDHIEMYEATSTYVNLFNYFKFNFISNFTILK